MNNKITQERLKFLLSLDEKTGLFYWKNVTSNCVKVGELCKDRTVRGYGRVQLDGIRYKAHSLVWLYLYGEFPESSIDHIDCDTKNNRPNNLRLATQSENCANRLLSKNSTTGVKGVFFHKRDRAFVARVCKNGIRYELGRFSDLEFAELVVSEARAKLHKQFANDGRRQCR